VNHLALQYHPDMAQSTADTQIFRDISEAWSVLSKPDLRTQYNRAKGIALQPTDLVGDKTAPEDIVGVHHANYQIHRAQAQVRNPSASLRSKYRFEEWQNLPLDKKKVCGVGHRW
jgi:DnaJ-class molecular chaperone